jgi:glycosyltransferase involved in cell wall biosynthesis
MRLAWFSPMPPVRTGIAAVSAELVEALRHEYEIDVYTDDSRQGRSRGEDGAHDFLWRHRQRPYDLTVYQVGNSSHHDYSWPYLFRYPGLTVLHDAHVHHARAAALLRTRRAQDYRVEFGANHPDANPNLAELAVKGFDNHLYYSWPMTRLIIEASRMTAVHMPAFAASLRAQHPSARIEAIRLAHGEPIAVDRARAARSRVRSAHGINADAIVFGVFGGLTPEKRIPQILDALAAILPYAPAARLLLCGAAAQHFDAAEEVRARGLGAHVTMTGYLPDDRELIDHMAACDVSINLRWPTAREMSGPWLRALAAGLPTITTDLVHLADVPSLDPRTWARREGMGDWRLAAGTADANGEPRIANREPVTIAIDILDEDHSLRLAMRRLATDGQLRSSLGASARSYWDREHSLPRMLEDYRRVISEAAAVPPPKPQLPAHLVNDGDQKLQELLRPFAITEVLDAK